MTNKQLAPKVRAWLKSTDVGPEDVRRSVGIVSGRAEHTRQRGRWWPLPSFRRRTESHVASTDTQPSPVPASNGHTPTVIGRTTSMLSPVKAITAGALIFAIGGAFLIAQPFDQQSGVPGAETPRLVTPVEVSGTAEPTGSTEDDAYQDGNVSGYRNLVFTLDFRMSDERITGLGTRTLNEDWYIDESGEEYPVSTGARTLVIENDGGAWRQRPTFWFETDWTTEPEKEVIVLDGEGDYDGLVALLEVTMPENRPWQYRGFIFDGELPPVPGSASTH